MLKYIFLLILIVGCRTLPPECPDQLPCEPVPTPTPKPDPLPIIDSCVYLSNYELDKKGPYAVKSQIIDRVRSYRPDISKCKMTVVHYSNGTGAPCIYYEPVLKHLASYGYLALCYESRATGSGKPCMDAISTAMGTFKNRIYKDKFISTGHSQGGGAAHICQYLTEKKYTSAKVVSVGIAPAHGMNRSGYRREYPQIKGPVLMVSGSRDTMVANTWVDSGYKLIKSEKVWIDAVGANHFNTNNWAKVAIVSFGTWKLFNDKKAGDYFNGMLNNAGYWKLIKKHD